MADVVVRVDAFDLHGQARAIRTTISRGRPVAGRACWGRRQDAWQALEGKTVVDAAWDAAGVARAPSDVVAVAEAPAAA